MNKTLKCTALTITPIVIILGLVITYVAPDMCANEIYNEITSPDTNNKIVLFERNCGATTGFSSQISIIKNNENLKNDTGNIYIAKGKPLNFHIKWTSNADVYISTNSTQIYKQETTLNNINVHYN